MRVSSSTLWVVYVLVFNGETEKQRGNDSKNLSIQWTLINIHDRCNHKQFPALDITFKPRAFLYQFDCSTSQYKPRMVMVCEQ